MTKRPSFGGGGLAHVSTENLTRLLSRVHDGSLECPITHPTLLRAGMPDLVDELGHLVGLEARAVQAVLVAVIAERRTRA
ncbi:MAG: hypothetical protein J0L92_35475 [Deltaproteobacteria bacterium]|nr:hypothetical protein [Deltaproteobacteria bacterium]